MKNKLIIACAGAGKTTYLIDKAIELSNSKILITTFTDENYSSINLKFIKKYKVVPNHVRIQTWFSFLLEHCIKPFQGKVIDENINGILLVNGKSGFRFKINGKPVYWDEGNTKNYYFSKDMLVYSDKISKLALKCNEENNNLVFQRIKSLCDYIFIDEIQDMAGFDFELIKSMMEYGIKIIMVGDPRQITYKTHHTNKNKKYNDENLKDFFEKKCSKICEIDEKALNVTHRCRKEIIDIANKVFPQYTPANSDFEKLDDVINGVYFFDKNDVFNIQNCLKAEVLRFDKRFFENDSNVINIGKSKGLEFDHTLLILTKDMIDWFFKPIELGNETKAKLYVALTRARFSCGICIENINKYLEYLNKERLINNINIYRLKR